MKVIPETFVDRAIKAQEILLNKWVEEKDPIKKQEYMIDAYTHPMATPAKVIILGTAAGTALGWLAQKEVAKHFTKKQVQDIEKIKAELEKSHTPKQKGIYEEIRKYQEESKSLSKKAKSLSYLKIMGTNPFVRAAGKFGEAQTNLKVKPTEKYLAILVRRYENSLNNYQLSLYKTLFESQYKVLAKKRMVGLITVLGAGIVSAAITIGSTVGKDKDLKNFIKEQEASVGKPQEEAEDDFDL